MTSATTTETMTAVDRLALFCEWFDLTPPKVRKRLGDIVLTPDFIKWADESGASINWLAEGGTMEEAAAYREKWLEDRKMKDLLANFDSIEFGFLRDAFRDHQEGRVASLEIAMQGWRDAVLAYRAGRAA
ncbi:hypothetical protein [Cereibacter azotoformans]|uniref:Uncharacterized protein n=1 Tax=Cereibacter azotoformans TaxID=43057 RepID=A0A2T5JXS5_9RHOB|nr:hypothetical protein [Cereibacter azotoformans]MBO4169696.1 hypothetical protein [Cereibacter azotoformans]PTR14973.1 hypothetical protein C8J28_115118 [Cereibacter azotoformans]